MMPIVIKRFSEPLSAPPFTEWDGRIAGSRARDTLRSLLVRYCERSIAGRSILIAGHRGAGKTTLVKSVIEEVFHNPALEADARPLFVYLHGPDLVAGVDVLGNGKKKDESDSTPAATNVFIVREGGGPAIADEESRKTEVQPDQERLATLALRQLTVALHQAFATHVGWQMQKAAHDNDRLEEAAQFRLDADRRLDVSDLRLFWSRMGVLETGLLRNRDSATSRYHSSQGTLEIVALASLSEAYTRAIAKDVEESEGQELEEKRERKQELQKSHDRKELVNAIAGLLSGGAAGVGVAVGAGSTPAKVMLGSLAFCAATILTSAVLNLATMRSFSQKRSKERKVIYDDSLGSLELIVPLLIRRVQDAGLAPVFVVDELDKVDGLEDKMQLLLRQLKHIVADKSFCCFLVDREYFDTVRNWESVAGRSQGLTFFGERLYVIMRPRDWHDYLAHVLEVNESSKLMDFAATVLSYVLLARSKMHAIDMRRELEKLPRRAGNLDEIALGASDILTRPDYQNAFLYQLAVEFLLEDAPLNERVEADPTFLQVVYDALYFPLRKWEKGADPEWGMTALTDYLWRCTGIQAG
jgi:hypothetical protein